MSNNEIQSRFHIIHLEVAHGEKSYGLEGDSSTGFHEISGSDRYEIHLHMERPPVVKDLMEELEKKARVTLINQQILYRGTMCDVEEIERGWFRHSLRRTTFTSNTGQTVGKIRFIQWKSPYSDRGKGLLISRNAQRRTEQCITFSS